MTTIISKYLVKRRRDNNYSVRIQYPQKFWKMFGAKSLEKSLKTSDRKLAETLAAPYVYEYKEVLYKTEMMNGLRGGKVSLVPMLEPGEIDTFTPAEGGAVRMFASRDGKTIFLSDPETSEPLGEVPNRLIPSFEVHLNKIETKEMDILGSVVPDAYGNKWPVKIDPQSPSERDAEIIDFWCKTQESVDVQREARRVYRELRELFPGVTLEKATGKQAEALAEFYRDKKGNLAISAIKKVRWLSTIMREGKRMDNPVVVNPFEGVHIIDLPGADGKKRKSTKIIPLEEDEAIRFMRSIPGMKSKPHNLPLLAILVACTGMRPAEVCAIENERRIKAGAKVYRCIDIDAGKTDSSTRTVPLPDCVLPFLPARIEGPLFTSAPIHDPAKFRRFMVHRSNDMMSYVRAIGINSPQKRFYSLRHGAITALTSAGVLKEIALEIVGHDETLGVHRNYIFGQSAYGVDKLAEAMTAIWMPYADILAEFAETIGDRADRSETKL